MKSDVAISQDLKQSLRSAIKKLEDIPARHKDYHPGSDGKVLDLVHPSLFPLIYGRSRILEDRAVTIDDCIQSSGNGKVIAVRPVTEQEIDLKGQSRYGFSAAQSKPYSGKFQWLPCDVDISEATGAKYKVPLLLVEKH